MKTATVTWIKHKNYGTYLQCYALQKYLQINGFDNVILSDLIVANKCSDVLPPNPPSTFSFSKAIHFCYRLGRLFIQPWRIRNSIQARLYQRKYDSTYSSSQKLFDQFRHENLSVRYLNLNESHTNLNDHFDAFICGSDQIWSMIFPIQPYYFLDFVHTKKKIAYAPSLGTSNISTDRENKLKELLSDFSAISVRESFSSSQLSAILNRPVEWVLDPTLLHDDVFWSNFCQGNCPKRRKYLLCYFLNNSPWYFDYAKRIAREKKLQLILIPNREEYVGTPFVKKGGIGPKEFVSLFMNAEYVLTDSYHGSIFSIIFSKPFLHFLRFSEDAKNSENIRIHSLFDYLSLNSIIVKENQPYNSDIPIDYTFIHSQLDTLRKRSENFLLSHLSQ